MATGLFVDGDLGQINQRVFQRRGVLRQYAGASDWLEPGEREAVLSVAYLVQGGAILDIGVGGGRTAPLLSAISADYTGIDFAPAMVALAHRRFPDFDFREMDARRLAFPDGKFALAVFSYNGIDSVDLAGRRMILQEVHRVLRPGGYFVFSALNRNADEGLPRWPDWEVFRGARLQLLPLLRATARLLVGGVNWLRGWHRTSDGGETAIGRLAAHNFALLTVFTSPAESLRQLQAAGFSVDAMYEPAGRSLAPDEQPKTRAPWYHIVARKAAA